MNERDEREISNSRVEAIDKMFFENDFKYIQEKEAAETFTEMIDGMSLAESAKVIAKMEADFAKHYLQRVESNLLTARDTLLDTNRSLKTQNKFRWMAIEVQDLIMRMDESIDKITKLKKDIT